MAQLSTTKDLHTQINAKVKSFARVNADGSLTVFTNDYKNADLDPARTLAPTVHQRVIFNVHTQSVTIGDGSGVRTVDAQQFLNSLS